MRHKQKITIICLALSLLFLGFGLPKNIEKRVVKEVEKIFRIQEFKMQAISVPETLNSILPTKITEDNFYAVHQNADIIGYAFVDKARSKTAQFDYLVIFDEELTLIHSKILIYREDYGGEIGSTRWLRQFMGKTGKDRVDYNTNIDGISGATISVRSMTMSIDNLLQTIGILQENMVL